MLRALPLLAALAGACDPAPPTPSSARTTAAAAVRQVDVAGLRADLDRGGVPLLLDVRTPEEYASGHVPGAVNIPVDQVASRAAEIPDKQAEVYVICQSGRRSQAASDQLAALGYRTVNVRGGTSAWVSAGHRVE